jgi:hypothetical protein
MTLQAGEVPRATAIPQSVVEGAYFRECYRVPLRRSMSVVEIYFAIFGHRPLWMKAALILRNAVAGLLGLEVPTPAEILRPRMNDGYAVGEKIGTWRIFALGEHELVAGHDDKHLDFRLSLLREAGSDGQATVAVSTLCSVHNRFGKVYLFFVIPLHKWGFQRLLLKAVHAGRL